MLGSRRSRESPVAVALGKRASKDQVALAASKEAMEEDDVPYDGSELGAWTVEALTPGGRLSDKEKAAAASYQRTSAFDDVEDEPLPGLLKVVTQGKELVSHRKHMFSAGVEGQCVCANPSQDTVAVGCRDSTILLLDAASLNVMTTVDLGLRDDGTITSMTFRPETLGSTQNVALLTRADSVLAVHTSTGKLLSQRREEGNKLNCMHLRPSDGAQLATAGADTSVRVYDEPTGRLACRLQHGDDVTTTGHSNCIYSVAWVPDQPQMLVSGGWDRSVKLWDLRIERVVRSVFGPYVCGDALSVRGGRLLTGSWRHSAALQQWDLGTGRLQTNMTFHQSEHEACLIYCAKFGEGNLDGLIYAGGSGKKPCFRLYHARGEVVGTMPLASAMVGAAQLSSGPRQRSLLICCTDRIVHLDV